MTTVYVSPDGTTPRWAWTEGLAASGREEIAAPLTWPAGDPRDRQSADLLAYVAAYVAEADQPLRPGETLAYGWTTLRFRASDDADALGPGLLIVQELAQPLQDGDEPYTDGAAQAIALLARQLDAQQRNVVPGEADPPHRSDALIVCTRVPPAGFLWSYPLFAARLDHDVDESGWFFGCYEQGHDHEDRGERERTTLGAVVAAFPRLFPYLALPVGTTVIFAATQTVVFRADDDEGYLDPGA